MIENASIRSSNSCWISWRFSGSSIMRRISVPTNGDAGQDPAGAAGVEHLRERVVVAGQQVETLDRRRCPCSATA